MTEQQIKLINELTEDVREAVERIEAKPETTRGHYGDYMALFQTVCNGNKTVASFVRLALIQAGGNQQGVNDAYRLIFGEI